MKNLVLMLALLFSGALAAQSPVGTWKTIDDKTGQPKSEVQIYVQNGKYYGKVTKFLRPGADPNRKCTSCTGALKDKPILGMVIVRDLAPSGKEWTKGTILDPESGTEYGCTIWFEAGKPDELKVRGYHWTGLYRTQTWHRVK